MAVSRFAQPYDISASGFLFDDYDDYTNRAAALRNAHGDPVEEFEIQFIDGEAIDCALAKAVGLNQANLAQFFAAVEDWDNDDKTRMILAVGECGYAFDAETGPDGFDLDIYQGVTMRELAEQFVEEGLIGDIPEPLQFYTDYDAIARDLRVEYSETEISGERVIYRCA